MGIIMTRIEPILNEASSLSLLELKELITRLSGLAEAKEARNETINKIKEMAKLAGLTLQDVLSVDDNQVDEYLDSHINAPIETKKTAAKPVTKPNANKASAKKPTKAKPSIADAPMENPVKAIPVKKKPSSVKTSVTALPGAKYRNPDNAMQEWTGRGAKPAWVKRLLDEGRTLSELEAS